MTQPEFVEVPFAVPAGTGTRRVDVFLAERLHGYSRSRVQSMIGEGRVWLRSRAANAFPDGARDARPPALTAARPVKASMKVTDGDAVVIRFPWRPDPPSRHSALEILHEDADVLAVNKPGDLLSHPTDKTTRASVVWILSRQVPGFRPFLVHRLDRETSGVLVFARNTRAARRLSEQFEDREARKEYWAVVRGAFPWRRKAVDRPVGSGGHEIRVRQSVSDEGQSARTVFSRLAASRGASLVRAMPRTGRLHQIRVHLAWLGYPVVGDKLYTGEGEAYVRAWKGSSTEEDLTLLGAGRQMLHARRLELRHPTTGGRLSIEAPLPEDFSACLKEFGLPFGGADEG